MAKSYASTNGDRKDIIHVKLIPTTDPAKRALILSDSEIKRLAIPAILNGPPLGHYKLSFVDRFSPPLRDRGIGQVRVSDLNNRDIKALMDDEKIEETLDDDAYRIGGRKARVGALNGEEGASIHGGGETLAVSTYSPYQRITKPANGVRLHNSDLAELMNYLEPRLRCLQLVIFSIL